MIKYKGQTSNLLSDLSRELGNAMDLRTSELILKGFFQRALNDVSIDTNIEILCALPVCVKPFCQKNQDVLEIEHVFFQPDKLSSTLKGVFKVLSKYVSSETLLTIYCCFPENTAPEALILKKEVFLAA